MLDRKIRQKKINVQHIYQKVQSTQKLDTKIHTFPSYYEIRPYEDELEKIHVRCGEWDYNSDQEWYQHQDREVDSISLHPRFVGGDKEWNDIALVHVKHDFELANDQTEQNLNVAPICLPPFDEDDHKENECYSMGWGKKSFNADSNEETMKQVHVPMVTTEQCQKALRSTRLPNNFRLHPSTVCAGGIAGQDACGGDGGGPLVCESRDDPNR